MMRYKYIIVSLMRVYTFNSRVSKLQVQCYHVFILGSLCFFLCDSACVMRHYVSVKTFMHNNTLLPHYC
jgi:hypothetical protein